MEVKNGIGTHEGQRNPPLLRSLYDLWELFGPFAPLRFEVVLSKRGAAKARLLPVLPIEVAVTGPEPLDSVGFEPPFVSAFDLTHVDKQTRRREARSLSARSGGPRGHCMPHGLRRIQF
jgi:hypothetical protein